MTTGDEVIECGTCKRMFHNYDGTGVCPDGHGNPWAGDDEDAEYEERLRKVMW